MRRRGGILTTIIIAVMMFACSAIPSAAARKHAAVHGRFDGLWSVSIFTREGPCDAAYRYPARILGTRVLQIDSEYDYQLYGIVTSKGGISVTVSRGGHSATGYGRLRGSQGAGWWKTDGGQCSGVWSAIRRG